MNTELLYVSRRLVPYPDTAGAIRDILAVSRVRNAQLDLTGALIATPEAFAQLLEGPPNAVEGMMTSIEKDPRHCALCILSHAASAERRFDRWCVAYWGASTFIARHIEPLAKAQGTTAANAEDVTRLFRLLDAFRNLDAPLPSRTS